MKNCISLFYMLLCYISFFSQNSKKHYEYFDQIVGLKNTNLSYGKVFIEKYRKFKNNHNYFISNKFQTGNINYNGENYFGVNLKYNLADDELITFIKGSDNEFSIILEKKLILNFNIYGSKFSNIKEYGFLEQIITDKPLTLYKKHLKVKHEKIKKNLFYHNFTKKYKFLIRYENNYYYVKTKRDFLKIFPKLKKNINAFYKKYKFLKKKNPEKFIINFCKKLNKEFRR